MLKLKMLMIGVAAAVFDPKCMCAFEESTHSNKLECQDGTEWKVPVYPKMWTLQEATQCEGHGGRRRCPKTWPVMCADPNSATGDNDYSCQQSAKECKEAGGPRKCRAVKQKEEKHHGGNRNCAFLYPQDSDYLLCNNHHACKTPAWPNEWNTKQLRCCDKNGGRRSCPRTFPWMCESPTSAELGNDHACTRTPDECNVDHRGGVRKCKTGHILNEYDDYDARDNYGLLAIDPSDLAY